MTLWAWPYGDYIATAVDAGYNNDQIREMLFGAGPSPDLDALQASAALLGRPTAPADWRKTSALTCHYCGKELPPRTPLVAWHGESDSGYLRRFVAHPECWL